MDNRVMIQLNDWLSIDKTSGEGDATITLTASSSIALQDRIQKLTIKGVTKNNYVTVQQKKFIAEFYLANDNIVSQKEGGVFTNTVTSNLPWVAEVSGSWINMSVLSGDVGTTDFTVTINSAFIERDGNVIFKTLNGDILGVIDIKQFGDLLTDKFWIEFEEPNGLIKIESNNGNYVSRIQYSFNGIDWESATGLMGDGSISMGENLFVFLRNANNRMVVDSSHYDTIYMNKKAKIGGDITQIVKEMESYCCYQLFSGTDVTDASKLNLPWKSLSPYCYWMMFRSCPSLVNAPKLPATELAKNCYQEMFRGCTSLVTAPELPATKLGKFCYYAMFYDCTSLVNVPELPATTLYDYCYSMMFRGCTSLTQAPILPANTLTEWCYDGMFIDCSSLSYIKMLAIDFETNSFGSKYEGTGWVDGVASSGTFIKHPDADLPIGEYGIPEGWTVETATE